MFTPAPEPETPLGRVRILSPMCGLRVSPLQLGAMSIGEAWSGFMGSMDKEKSFALLDAFVAAGGNFIDTANNYQCEESETWLGEWMAERKNRHQLVIATKFTSDYASYRTGPGSHAANFVGNHKKSLHNSLRDSLKKLQTDYIDILYLHWWDWTTSIEEIMDALDIVVKQGKVLYLGVSDTPAWIVSAANTYAKAHGKTPFVIYQGRWNVMRRDFERDILPMARHFGMALAPWDVLASGRLASKKTHAERKAAGEKIRQILMPPDLTVEELKMIEVLEEIAVETGVEGNVPAIATAYVMAKSPYVFPILGGRKVEYLHNNIDALKVKLSAEQIKKIEAAQPFDIGFPLNFVGQDPKDGADPSIWISFNSRLDYVQNEKPIGYSG